MSFDFEKSRARRAEWQARLHAGAAGHRFRRQLLAESPRLLTVGEVARIYGMTTKTVLKWIGDGVLPAIRIGRWIRIVPDDVLTMIEAHRLRPDPRRP